MNARIEHIDIELFEPTKNRLQLGQHSGQVVEGLLLCRITTSDGIEGCAGLTTYTAPALDRSLYASLCNAASSVVGMAVSAREHIQQQLWRRYDFLRYQSSALIDIALWDAAAKAAQQPLYRLLGAARERVPVYASIPTYPNLASYLEQIEQLCQQPYHAIKIHPFCHLEQDLQLIEAIAQRFAGKQRFYFDAEGQYNREQAAWIGRVLDQHPCFVFFEAPLPDTDLDGYTWLRSQLKIPLVMSGIELFSPALQAHALRIGACDRLRFDTTLTGGISAGRKLAALAEAAGISCEIQSWGFLATQAANLHLMLATANATGFELAIPHQPYLWGSEDSLPIDPQGYIHANDKPGLGIDYPAELVNPCRAEHYRLRRACN